ncbi:MAG: kynureninase [Actinomycetota bacterium]
MTLTDPGPYHDASGYYEAKERDENDPLAPFRHRFVHSDPGLIYLDGNSLGRLPVAAVETIEEVSNRQWGDRLIRSWNEGWWDMPTRVGDLLAPLLGASPGEVIISDSTTVNLYKLATAALASCPGDRNRIVTDDLNFPSDAYVLDSVARRFGGELEIVASDGINGPIDRLTEAIDDRTALVSLSHTTFKSGYTYDLGQVTELAHGAGARMLWDCSHSVGSVPIDLDACDADLAVGCTYKYLNGGPGSPAFLYVREDLQDVLENPIAGWWGHSRPFSFDLAFVPMEGIRRFQTGTMPILSLAPIEAGVSLVLEAGIDAVREKSMALSEYLISQAREHLEPLWFEVASPTDPERRGSHVAISHEMAWPITRAMTERANVIPDFRTPDSIRLGLSPLYTSFVDVHTAVQRIVAIIKSKVHTDFVDDTATVT